MKPIESLYNTLVQDGYDVGDLNTFSTKLQDSNKAKALYDAISTDGYDVGDFDNFYGKLKATVQFDDYSKKLGAAPVQPKVNTSMYVTPELEAQAQQQAVPQNVQPLSPEEANNVIYGSIPGTTKIGNVNIAPIGKDWQQQAAQLPTEQPTTMQGVNAKAPQVEMMTSTFEQPKVDEGADAFDFVEKFNQGGANVGKNIFGSLQKLYSGLKNDLPLPGANWYYGKAEDAMAYLSNYFAEVEKQMIANTDKYNGKDFMQLAKEGDYSGVVGDIMLNATSSLPQSLMIMFGGGTGLATSALATQNEAYDQLEGKDMSEVAKIGNSILNSAIQTGTEFMSTIPMGKVLTGLATKVGKEETAKLMQASTKTWLDKLFKQYGVYIAPVSEGIEEFTSQVGTNTLDYLTGATSTFEPFKDSFKSFVYGAGGGAQFSMVGIPMQAAQQVKSKKDFENADRNLVALLSRNGFTREDVDDIKNSLLQATPENRNSVVVAISQAIDGAITKTDGKVSFNPEVSNVFTNFLLSSDRLQSVNKKYSEQLQANTPEGILSQYEKQFEDNKQPYMESIRNEYNYDKKAFIEKDIESLKDDINWYSGLANGISTDGMPITAKDIKYYKDVLKTKNEKLLNATKALEAVTKLNNEQSILAEKQQAADQLQSLASPDGMIRTVKMMDGTEMVIRGENIVFDPETGRLDRKNSSEMLYYTDQETGEVKVLNPKTVDSILSEKPIEQAALEADQQIDQEISDQEIDEFLPLQPETYQDARGTIQVQYNPETMEIEAVLIDEQSGTPMSEPYAIDKATYSQMSGKPMPEAIKTTANEPLNEGSAPVVSNDMTENAPLTAETAPLTAETAPLQQQYPVNKKGEIDFDAMTVAQTYQYMVDNYGEKEAIDGLKLQEHNILAAIQANIKALDKAKMAIHGQIKNAKSIQEQLKIREKNKAAVTKLTDERTALDTQLAEIRALMPQVKEVTPAPEVKTVTSSNVRPEEQLRREQEAKAKEVSSEQSAVNSEEVAPEAEQQPVIEVRAKEKNKNIINPWQKRLNNLGDAQTLEDLVLRRIAGGAKFVWNAEAPHKGLAQELGFKNNPTERELRKNMIDDKNGMTPQDLAHAIYESGDLEFMGNVDYQDIYNAVVDTLLQVNSATAAMEMAEKIRDERDFNVSEQAEWDSRTPEEIEYLESIPDDILESYLGITNFTPEQLDIIQNLQNEYYGTDRTTTETSAVDSTPGIESETEPRTTEEVNQSEQQLEKVTDEKKYAERFVKSHKGIIYQNTISKYQYEVTGYNAGYITLTDLETGKTKRVKDESDEWLNNFVDITEEVGLEERGVTSQSGAVENGTNYDITQYGDNVFELQESGRSEAPLYRIVLNDGYNVDNADITKNGNKLKKNETPPANLGWAIQHHLEKFNPESKQRLINKILEKQSSGNKLPEQARPTIDFNNWKWEKVSTNAIVIRPNTVGKPFTDEQFNTIMEWGKKNNFTPIRNSRNTRIEFVVDKLDNALIDYLDSVSVKAINDKKAADEKAKKEEAEKAKKEELRNTVNSNPATSWINREFGEDAMNDYNKNALAKFLSGETKKFEGQVNNKWVDAITRLKALTEDGKGVDFDKLKKAYEQSEAKQDVKNEIPVSEDGLYQIREVKVKKNDDSLPADNSKNNSNFAKQNKENGSTTETRLDNRRTVEDSAIDKLVGGSETGRRIYKTIETSNNTGGTSSILTVEEREELESRGINPDFDKDIFREALTKNASENGVLLDKSYLDDKTLIHDKKANNTAENDVYLNQDKTTITKVNDLNYVLGTEKHNNLSGTIDRLLSHNSLFPEVAYTIKGFIINKDGKISLVMEQPLVEAERNATRQEIEEYLTDKGFKLDGTRIWSNYSDVWSNGEYDIYDARPANVLKGKDGKLYFIDTFPHSTEYFKQAEAKPKETVKEEKQTSPELELVTVSTELAAAKAKYDKAQAKYLDLKNKLEKDPAFGMGGQTDIFGNVSGADKLFGNDGQKQAVEAVQAAKKQADDLKPAVDELQTKADKLREAVTNKILKQQGIKFEEEKAPEGFRKNFDNEFGSFTSVFAYVNPNNPKEFMVQTTVRKANADGTISMQKHEKWMPIEKYDDFVADLDKRAETKEQPQGEFKYRLLFRPLSIGTHPKEGFVKHEEDGTKYGQLTYNRKLSKEEVKQFELEPVVNTDIYDGKDIVYMEDGADKYLATVSFTEYRGRKFAQIAKRDLEGTTYETETLTIPEFENKIESGEYKLVDEQTPQAEQPLSAEEQEIVDTDSKIQNILHDNQLKYAVSQTGFYSTVEKALEAIQQEKGSKDQFRAMLLKNGAKQAEMDWMGFDELPEKLTKSDIQNWIDENRIEVREVEKTDREKATDRDVNKYTKYHRYVLPGGKNYKELLLTMPSVPEKTMGELEYMKSLNIGINDVSDFRSLSDERQNELMSDYRDYTQGIEESKRNAFKSSHFDEPNILAHVRFNERTVNGERVLFIEEFQSDFSQSLKKKEDEFKKLLKENPEKVLDMFKKSGKLEVLCP